MYRIALAFALTLALPTAALALDQAGADTKLKKLLDERGARPGGILRVQRFPLALAAGWKVTEDRDDSGVRLEVSEQAWLYYVDHKCGPMYEHTVEYVLIGASGKLTSQRGSWWPRVLGADGKPVEEAAGKKLAGWWNAAAYTCVGDALPSIQAGQGKVKWDYMFAKLPAGSRSLVLYSCPATLPEKGAVWVGEEQLHVATHSSFVMLAEFNKGKPWPHAAKLIVFDRKTGEKKSIDISAPPVLKTAKGEPIATTDGGDKLGAWYADSAHSFLARMSIGR